MLTIRKADERPTTKLDWLDSRHTFGFGRAHDPSLPHALGFRALRVINDDVIAPGQGFGAHPHRDMEILSFVTRGALAHRDSTASDQDAPTIRPGDVQAMTAGSGITHSEFNPSQTDETRLIQVWIQPREQGLPPRYEQRHFPPDQRTGRLRLVASPDGQDESITIQQDARIYNALLESGAEVSHAIAPERHAWVQVAEGVIELGAQRLEQGDGAAISNTEALELRAIEDSEVLVFDLA